MKTNGTQLIEQERVRQIDAEGFSESHDAEHVSGELIQAALFYIQCANYKPTVALGWDRSFITKIDDPFNWPWADFKPSGTNDRDRELDYLAKAGALIAAEIDRRLNWTERRND